MTTIAKRQVLPLLRQGRIAPITAFSSSRYYSSSACLNLRRSSFMGLTNTVGRNNIFMNSSKAEIPIIGYQTIVLATTTARRSYATLPSTTDNQQPQNQQVQQSEVPAKKQSKIVELFQKSKALVVFYKNGLKELWANKKAAKALIQQVEQQGYQLTRSDYQLIHKSKKDMIKLAPFGLIFLVLPESIPLFVIFAPGIIPSTCVTESQVLKQRQKLDEARQRMSSNVITTSHQIGRITPEDFLSLRKFLKIAKGYQYDFELPQISKDNLGAYCRFMGLKSWGTKGMLEKRLNKHLDYLLEDDKLIAKEGVQSLSTPDLQQAVEERGMRSVNVDEEQLQRSLDYWISVHLNEQESIPRGLLVFSRMFLLNANYSK